MQARCTSAEYKFVFRYALNYERRGSFIDRGKDESFYALKYIKKYGKEVASATCKDKKMPNSVAVSKPLIQGIKHNAASVEHAPDDQPHYSPCTQIL